VEDTDPSGELLVGREPFAMQQAAELEAAAEPESLAEGLDGSYAAVGAD
jgi:hypothetical protein